MTFNEMIANNKKDFKKFESDLIKLGFKLSYNGEYLKEYKNRKGATYKIMCNY